jgi:hypothetical protein
LLRKLSGFVLGDTPDLVVGCPHPVDNFVDKKNYLYPPEKSFVDSLNLSIRVIDAIGKSNCLVKVESSFDPRVIKLRLYYRYIVP